MDKSARRRKRIRINKVTIRRLQRAELERVAGGDGGADYYDGQDGVIIPTDNCTVSCTCYPCNS